LFSSFPSTACTDSITVNANVLLEYNIQHAFSHLIYKQKNIDHYSSLLVTKTILSASQKVFNSHVIMGLREGLNASGMDSSKSI